MPGLIGAHHTAAKSRAEAHALLAGKLDDVVRFTPGDEPIQENFVVLATTLFGSAGERLTEEQAVDADCEFAVTAHVVAVDADGAYLLTDALSEQFMGHRLVVAGRATTALRREELSEPEWDPRARMVYIDVVFEATTSRAVGA